MDGIKRNFLKKNGLKFKLETKSHISYTWLRHEAIGAAMVVLDAIASDIDVTGELSALYYPAYLGNVLELSETES